MITIEELLELYEELEERVRLLEIGREQNEELDIEFFDNDWEDDDEYDS